MAFIRSNDEMKTCLQLSCDFVPELDYGTDFVLVYGAGRPDFPDRIRQYREQGYKIVAMTGIAWGAYQSYLYGEYDGTSHEDESQQDRSGNKIWHGERIPYIAPTVEFADYITEALKPAVDAGVDGLCLEEPEFFDRAGYSEAFKREFRNYYRREWVAPHTSPEARSDAARLKAYLYKRTIERVCASLRSYSMKKYGRRLPVYIATHSLLNYTMWKIVSPESLLRGINDVDGYIAQIWTGTARTPNWYDGEFAERTFETGLLEYGIMEGLAAGRDMSMYLLHDPIEDNPNFGWDDYRKNYYEVVTASLLCPGSDKFEVCPWPNRIINNKYPAGAEDATFIPADYRASLSAVFQALGDVPVSGDDEKLRVGIFMDDSEMFRRGLADTEIIGEPDLRTGTVLPDTPEEVEEYRKLIGMDPDDPLREKLLKAFKASSAFPSFFGPAMSLLKFGLKLKPVPMDLCLDAPQTLDEFHALVLTYDFIDPPSPGVDAVIAAWVKRGGTLVYVGKRDRSEAAERLFALLGVDFAAGVQRAGSGIAAYYDFDPAEISLSHAASAAFRKFTAQAMAAGGKFWNYKNHFTQRRGNYLAAAVMKGSITDRPLEITGTYADIFSVDLDVVTEKTVRPGETALLYDIDAIREEAAIVATGTRVYSFDCSGSSASLDVRAAEGFLCRMRIKLPFVPTEATASDADGNAIPVGTVWDDRSGTVLLRFDSKARKISIA